MATDTEKYQPLFVVYFYGGPADGLVYDGVDGGERVIAPGGWVYYWRSFAERSDGRLRADVTFSGERIEE